MRVIVIGSGLIGVTTAYSLRRRGHEVVVIDRQSGPGQETSFANGALLTPSMADPWNSPGCWRTLIGSLVGSDAALQLRLSTLPALVGWGMRFLRYSAAPSFERNGITNLRLALYSLQAMGSLRERTRIEYGRVSRGSLRVFRDPAMLDQAFAVANHRIGEGLQSRKLSTSETIELQPGLTPVASQLVGAMFYQVDEVGDAREFCVNLVKHEMQQGIEFHFQTNVSSLEIRGGQVAGVITDKGRIEGDRYVVAAGSYSTTLLRSIGIKLPVRPVKGYSVTIDGHWETPPIDIPVIDDEAHAVVVPLGRALRVAGTAEFAGYDLRMRTERVRNLMSLLENLLPGIPVDSQTVRSWCGLRSVSADGVPIIGRTFVANVLVNTGHGHLGWTTAAGSAELLADVLTDNAPSIDPMPFRLARFG